jgi:hypothetical protein
MLKLTLAISVVLVMVGCRDVEDAPSRDRPEERALNGTNISVKELVACGGMQYAAMRGLAGSIVSEAGYPDIAAVLFGETSLERSGADYVTLLPGGVFTMRFAGADGPLMPDVFSFSSYVADPMLDTPESLDAWRAGDIDFALHFSGPGPLFELLDAGRGLQSPIRFQITQDDVFNLAFANQLQGDLRVVFGPLLDSLQIDSDLDFQDVRDGVGVAYTMATPPSSILGLLDGGELTMLIEELESRYDRYTVRPTDVDVHYIDGYGRGLAGTIRYAVFDDPDATEPVCTALADYGDGAVYGKLSSDCD